MTPMAERRLDDAQMVAAELVASLPDDAEVHAFHGDVMDELGRTEEAVASYERAVTINPESQLDRIRLVQLRRKLENTDFDVAEPVRRRRMNVPALAAGSVLMACVISERADGLCDLRDRAGPWPREHRRCDGPRRRASAGKPTL